MGVLRIGDTEIPCAVLEDGRRVLTQGGFLRAIGRNRKPKAGHGGTGVDVTLPFLTAKNLKPFIIEDSCGVDDSGGLPAVGRRKGTRLRS